MKAQQISSWTATFSRITYHASRILSLVRHVTRRPHLLLDARFHLVARGFNRKPCTLRFQRDSEGDAARHLAHFFERRKERCRFVVQRRREQRQLPRCCYVT